jgi:hypothetical protein
MGTGLREWTLAFADLRQQISRMRTYRGHFFNTQNSTSGFGSCKSQRSDSGLCEPHARSDFLCRSELSFSGECGPNRCGSPARRLNRSDPYRCESKVFVATHPRSGPRDSSHHHRRSDFWRLISPRLRVQILTEPLAALAHRVTSAQPKAGSPHSRLGHR